MPQAQSPRAVKDAALDELVSRVRGADGGVMGLAELSRLADLAMDQATACRMVGGWLRTQGRAPEAEAWLRRSLAAQIDSAETYAELGATFMDRGRLEEACAQFEAALQRDPSLVMARCNLATCLYQLGRLPEALHEYRRVARAAPGFVYPCVQVMSIARQLSDFRHWEADAAQLRQLEPDATNHASQLDLLFLPLTAQQLLRHARAHAEGTGSGVHSRDFSARSRRQGRVQPIRIGYLSDDLRDHVVGSLLAQVLELHDRRCFEIHVFDWKAPTNTIIERRLRRAGVVRHDIRELTDEQAAARIAALGMDILVDLKGYMSGHRIGILRHRAAPVQVSWLGYPGTVGDPCMDYIIADQQTIPASLEEAYSESVLRLPTVFFPHDGNRPIARPSIRAMYGLPENAFVFCYLGRSAKILPEVFEDWIRILAAVPDSVLWLRSDNTVARENLRALARSGGLATERLVFGGDEHARTAELVARYLLADLALDTCPYGSHVTASEALWACCPLITRMESTFASRVAGSLLEAAGLGELVTHSREEFRRLAIELGQDRQRVLALRRRLESTRSSNPLFDAPRFVRELELAYRMVFERFVEGLPPQSLDVPAVQGSVAGSTAAPRRR